jgi:arylsulfatase A-like enzyme
VIGSHQISEKAAEGNVMKAWLAILIPLFLLSCASIEQPAPPNILLILADDLGYSDIGCYGGGIETPNLDRLALNGIRFTQFYNTARCCPSRASLLTGLHPHQTGMGAMVEDRLGVTGYTGQISENCVTLAEVLKLAGYGTYCVGKWHVTHAEDGSDTSDWPLQRGFDRFFGTIYGAGSYFDPRRLYYDNQIRTSSPNGFYYTDAISDTAVFFLNDHLQEQGKSPFFLYVAYTAPHWPLHAKPEDIAKYKGRYDKGWDVLRAEKLDRMVELGLIDEAWDVQTDKRDSPKWEENPQKEWELNRMEVYAAMVDCMDQGIGRILGKLRDTGQLDNTLILFLSDNGACAETWSPKNPWANRYGPRVTRDGAVIDYSNDGKRMAGPPDTYYSYGPNWARYSNTPFLGYKSGAYEGGISTPFIVHWPAGFEARGELRKQMAGIIDILPTLAAAAGADYPETFKGNSIFPMPGLNLLPVFQNNEELVRDYYCVEHIGRKGIIGSGVWKLVQIGRRPWELYNLEQDRTETDDQAARLPELRDRLLRAWEAWASENFVLSLDELAEIRKNLTL